MVGTAVRTQSIATNCRCKHPQDSTITVTSRPTRRRLTVTDLMILIAGIAVGLWVAPEGWDSGVRNVISPHPIPITSPGGPLVLARAGPVCPARRRGLDAERPGGEPLRRPWPGVCAREPGAMACVAAILAMVLAGPLNLAAIRVI